MIQFAIVVLALLAVANYWIGRHFLYPPVVFCSVWAADLTLVWLAGPWFYPLSDATLLIFCCGGTAFSVGGILARPLPRKPPQARPVGKSSDRLLNLLLLIVIGSAPFVLRWIVQLASNYDAATFLMAARMAMLESSESSDTASVLFGNLVTLSAIVAMIAFLERNRHNRRAMIAASIAVLLSIAGGGRAGLASLALSLVCIDWLRSGRPHWKSLTAMSLGLLIIAGAMAIALQKGEASAESSLAENLGPVVDGFVLYAAGGIVAFDRVVREPNIVPHNWQISRVFLQAADKLGAHVDVPSLHADFVDVGLSGIVQNVYTMYFAYLDLGIIGMMLTVTFVGFVSTLIFRAAAEGGKIAIIVYSFIFGALLLSPFAENFFLGLNFSVKIWAVAWLVYASPAALRRFSLFLGSVHIPARNCR